ATEEESSPNLAPVNEFAVIKDLWQVNRRKKSQKSSSKLLLAKQYEPTVVTNSSSSSSLRIPKLLLPKVNRPAMYSLNGYVPKPSLQRLASSVPVVRMVHRDRVIFIG